MPRGIPGSGKKKRRTKSKYRPSKKAIVDGVAAAPSIEVGADLSKVSPTEKMLSTREVHLLDRLGVVAQTVHRGSDVLYHTIEFIAREFQRRA